MPSEAEKQVKERYPDAEIIEAYGGFYVDTKLHFVAGDGLTPELAWQSALERMESK